MKADAELIHGRIDIIDENLQVIDELAAEDADAFTENTRDILAAKHALQESIEACLDIGAHIIAAEGYRRPADYKDVFAILTQQQLIPGELGGRLQQMAKFRNLLVHHYARIHSRRLHTILGEDAADIRSYVKHILTYLQ